MDGLAPEEKEIGVGRTALHIAVRDDASGLLAAALLQARASVNISDEWRDSPLHAACAYGHLRRTRLLLDARADVAAKDVDGKTPRQVVLKMPGRRSVASYPPKSQVSRRRRSTRMTLARKRRETERETRLVNLAQGH